MKLHNVSIFFQRNKVAVGYFFWIILVFPFIQVNYHHLSFIASLISLAGLVVWFLLSIVLIYYPLKRFSFSDSVTVVEKQISPYLILGIFVLYNIFTDVITLNVTFMYKNFILKNLYYFFLISLVLLLGRYLLKIRPNQYEYKWSLIYIVLPLAILGSSFDVFRKGGFEDFVFGLWGNSLRVIFAFVAAYYEELLYRGFVFKTFQRIFKNPINAIVISGIFFGLSHIAPWVHQTYIQQALEATIEKAFCGMIYAYIYYKTRSLLPGTVLHAIQNLF